ncbi:hypothetical protein GGE65_008292 [Skermanella aerolata]|uniref:hypothetical protein n=1 Tax=Skermanella aerolata TaxID=393310 RepID=UPI003D1FC592
MTENIQNLGSSPGKNSIQMLIIIVLGGASLIFILMQYAGDFGKISGFVLLILWCISLPFVIGSALAALLNTSVYRKAQSAVRNGDVTPTWVVRNFLCNSILIVDEGHKKLYINGKICNYADVKTIECSQHKGKNFLSIILKKGQNPVNNIMMDDEASAKQAFERLENSLSS